jgi:prepilin-type N-terminal cleavage/methylation domain-containing protein
MTTSPIGQRNNFVVRHAQCAQRNTENAFTLIEVMISVAILSVGLVLILHGFTYSLSALRISESNLQTTLWAANKMAQAQILAKEDWDDFENGLDESLKLKRVRCRWKVRVVPVEWNIETEDIPENYEDFRKIEASVSWQEGKRKGVINLVTFMKSFKE